MSDPRCTGVEVQDRGTLGDWPLDLRKFVLFRIAQLKYIVQYKHAYLFELEYVAINDLFLKV